jgi:hypothetical protein
MVKTDTLEEYQKWYNKLKSRLDSMLLIEEEMRKSSKGHVDKEIRSEVETVLKVLASIDNIQERNKLDTITRG